MWLGNRFISGASVHLQKLIRLQVSQLFKIGSHNYEDLKQFSVCVDELLFKYNVHRDRALTYKSEEVQLTAVDEIYVEQDAEGHILKQIARVRLFFLGFLSGEHHNSLGSKFILLTKNKFAVHCSLKTYGLCVSFRDANY